MLVENTVWHESGCEVASCWLKTRFGPRDRRFQSFQLSFELVGKNLPAKLYCGEEPFCLNYQRSDSVSDFKILGRTGGMCFNNHVLPPREILTPAIILLCNNPMATCILLKSQAIKLDSPIII